MISAGRDALAPEHVSVPELAAMRFPLAAVGGEKARSDNHGPTCLVVVVPGCTQTPVPIGTAMPGVLLVTEYISP